MPGVTSPLPTSVLMIWHSTMFSSVLDICDSERNLWDDSLCNSHFLTVDVCHSYVLACRCVAGRIERKCWEIVDVGGCDSQHTQRDQYHPVRAPALIQKLIMGMETNLGQNMIQRSRWSLSCNNNTPSTPSTLNLSLIPMLRLSQTRQKIAFALRRHLQSIQVGLWLECGWAILDVIQILFWVALIFFF